MLLFDFQSNGESIGSHQTFGALESLDARAACEFVKSRIPHEPVAVIGSSLGGAAAILGETPLDVQAIVIEAAYPTIEEAAANRIAYHVGAWVPSHLLAQLLLVQLRPRIGVSAMELRPIDRIGSVKAPILMMAGSKDIDTTAEESRRLFQAAPDPKEYWEIPGAVHQDFHAFVRDEYEHRVIEFFNRYLTSAQKRSMLSSGFEDSVPGESSDGKS